MIQSGRISDFVAEGYLVDRRGIRLGYAVASDGCIVEVGDGEAPSAPDLRAVLVRGAINSHTHCGDYGLDVPTGMSLEQLVAPPNGLKHRYLREQPRERLVSDMASFSRDSASLGIGAFVDFREGGAEGCRMLREASGDAIVLGRPVSEEFDCNEISDILSVSDGIGLPSVSDMDHRYIEAVADEVRSRNGIFAIHVSERVREDIDFVLSLDPSFVVHMCEATDSDLLKCAEAEVPVVVCPRSNSYFGKVPPVARMSRFGVDIALGTDNGMICSPNLFEDAFEFCRLMQLQGGDPGDVWSSLVMLGGKILYRHNPIIHPTFQDRISVLPFGGGDPLGALSARDRIFGMELRE